MTQTHAYAGETELSISSFVQPSPAYPHNPLTAVTYRFRIDLPDEDVSPVEALKDFLSQVPADLGNGRRENRFVCICPERVLEFDGGCCSHNWDEDLLAKLEWQCHE